MKLKTRSILGLAVASALAIPQRGVCNVENDTAQTAGGGEAPAPSTAPVPATPKAPKKNKPHPKASEKKAAKAKPAKKAKKAKAGKKDSGDTTQALSEAAKSYTKDKKHKTAGGNVSIHNGDKVAKMLLGLSIDDVYKKAASVLKEPESALRKKYNHLNVGMQRMNLGNRIRAAL